MQTPRNPDAGCGSHPERLAMWLRRAALPLLAAGVFGLLWTFELTRLPAGMDSMSDIPSGATVLLDQRATSAREGMAILVELPQGGSLLSRLVRRDPDGALWVENDRQESRLPDSRSFGALPASCYRGAVLVVFPPEGIAEVPR